MLSRRQRFARATERFYDFDEELNDLKNIAEETTSADDKAIAQDPVIQMALDIVRNFLANNELLGYGGTAINNSLPTELQFYDFSKKIPDFDNYTRTPHVHAIQLADKLHSELSQRFGPKVEVTIRPGMIPGVLKVDVNMINVADLTYLAPETFERQMKDGFRDGDGIRYVSHNLLRAAMYHELAQPKGDSSRWAKVFTRLNLFNQAFPIKANCPAQESAIESQLKARFESLLRSNVGKIVLVGMSGLDEMLKEGGKAWRLPIDLLVAESDACSIVKKVLAILPPGTKSEKRLGSSKYAFAYHNIRTPAGQTMARIYLTDTCYSYHNINGISVGTIPTLVSLTMSAMASNQPNEIDENRVMCVLQKLVELTLAREQRRESQLTTHECVGPKENSKTHALQTKARIFALISGAKGPRAEKIRQLFFFKYNPAETTPDRRRELLKLFSNMDYSLLNENAASKYVTSG